MFEQYVKCSQRWRKLKELQDVNLNPLSGRKAANSVIFVPFMLLKTTKLNISIVDSLIFIVQVFL